MDSSFHSVEYLETLPPILLNKLYRQPSTALAIFRLMLSNGARMFVMSMLFLVDPLPATDLEKWIIPEIKNTRKKENALSLLARLQMLEAISKGGRPFSWSLKQPFRGSLRHALTGGGGHQSFGVPSGISGNRRVPMEVLDRHARTQWESILHYIVGSAANTGQQGTVEPSAFVKKLLAAGELIKNRHSRPEITQAGFAFLLEQTTAQVWNVLITYIEVSQERRDLNPEISLSFSFLLGCLEVGQDYSVEKFSQQQLRILDDLNDLGIVYRESPDSRCFYPTRLATALGHEPSVLETNRTGIGRDLSAGAGTDSGQGFIIIETNYRLYAYTSSPLQIAILGLFANIKARFANMVMGKVTRASVRRAVSQGITSDQVIKYLETHAHQQMRGNSPILPPTVVDQISLWQMESERMKATAGYLFKDFASAEDYEAPRKYAEEIGVLVWKNDAKRLFFVTKVEMIAAMLKKRPDKPKIPAS
ncbi:MAG: RNA polymerase II transcription factor B 52 kDa subunit [Vezdaea aestivalis]|nr:MAG: RNA polymerase II transcription factor B 52 kDa subunit [Vezdaea aestivalis]